MIKPYAEVIGDPIAHSKSPLIHKFWLDNLGIDADFNRAHVTPHQLETYIDRRRDDQNWRGCNVTIPHKVNIMGLVNDPGDVRATIGAMNTILRTPDGLIGTNTDAAGFYAPLADVDLNDAHVVMIGVGGAAHAILFALALTGVGSVTIMARNALKAAGLLARFGLRGDVIPLSGSIPPAALVVNASPLGMANTESPLWDLSRLQPQTIVYDIVYAPLITPLIAAAESAGLATIDGLEMLVGQAAIAFELFFGRPAPRDRDAELRAKLLA